ncbi:MAG: chemotaxis protein CheB [Candidatus Melainabacteria bacterium]|nr:chemotaxis protein CheB [Candidatus Melainabacteria bacterium]
MPEQPDQDRRNIDQLIVIGASAGGVESVSQVVHDLPGDFECPICITIHTTPDNAGRLPGILSRRGHLPAKFATDGEHLRKGNIYVAPPDQHLTVEGTQLRLSRGPKENRTRPAINPLFRSAARSFDGHIIGVILSGALDDGTAGMTEIKAVGGTAIVQDPHDAIFSGMPESAIHAVPIDHILKLSEIGPQLARLCRVDRTSKNKQSKPERTERQKNEPSVICPDCGGPLVETENEVEGVFFQCIVGHRMTADSLWSGQSEFIERTLWAAARALKERANFAQRMAKRYRGLDKQSARAAGFDEEALAASKDAADIELLIRNNKKLIADF